MAVFSTKGGGLDTLLHRPPPTAFQKFWKNPTLFITQLLYSWRKIITPKISSPVNVVCVSDTHNAEIELPHGDILIHAGDLTQSGTFEELQRTLTWLHSQPHQYKVVIGGNHDLLLDPKVLPKSQRDTEAFAALDWDDLIYLNNKAVTLQCSSRQIKIYGSPWTPKHGNWAFQYQRSQDIWRGSVPDDVDILITHGPPKGHLDLNFGCDFLLSELWRTRPLLHVFGHIHAGHGREWLKYDGLQKSYEAACRSGGGVVRLLSVVREFLWSYVSQGDVAKTLLVNASVVGGLRDELRRDATEVLI
jgi:Icc-related predicted phosphoesterase